MAPFSFDTFIFELGQSHMLAVASLTIFLYDICCVAVHFSALLVLISVLPVLTIDQEIELIHIGARWSFPKILYLLNRYFVLTIMIINILAIFLPDPPVPFCTVAMRYCGLGSIVAKYVLDVWLILRVYAIWERDHKIIIILGTFFVANVCVTCVIGGTSFHNSHTMDLPWPRQRFITGCFVTPPSSNYWIVFVSTLVFEVSVFVFTAWKAIGHMRADFAPRDTPLFTHLCRTGIMYFAAIALTMAFMSITVLTPLRTVFSPGLGQFLSAFVSTVCARMMLGIREVIKGDDHFSAVGPSDMQITGFNLSQLPRTTVDATHSHIQMQTIPRDRNPWIDE